MPTIVVQAAFAFQNYLYVYGMFFYFDSIALSLYL